MKKQSPLANIPTLPKTFSGQWMTFSHMANHYRKLVNVKPRVDTGIARTNHSQIAIQSPKRTRSKLKSARNGVPYSSSETINDPRSRISTSKRYKSGDYETPLKCSHRQSSLLSPNDSFNAGSSCSDGYQVVFGPSSIKSSVDALISDQDPDLETILAEPKLSSISIGEKIRKFLNHIHAQEEMSRPKLVKRTGVKQPLNSSRPLAPSRDRPRDQEAFVQDKACPTCSTDTRHSGNRHSRCFTPYKVSGNETNKRSVPKSPSLKRAVMESFNESVSAGNRLAHAQSSAKSPTKSSKKPSTQSPLLNEFNNFQGLLSSFGRKRAPSISKPPPPPQRSSLINSSNARKFSTPHHPHLGPRSVSVATIRGSDELTEDLLLAEQSPPPPASRHSAAQEKPLVRSDSRNVPEGWLQDKVEHGIVKINNAYFSLSPGPQVDHIQCLQQTSPTTSNLSVQKSTSSQTNHLPNKDSSRDSAYGFSSGESRITTRESTPEKKSKKPHESDTQHRSSGIVNHSMNNGGGGVKYKSSLSTVPSSINQDQNGSVSQLESLSDSRDSSPRNYGKNSRRISTSPGKSKRFQKESSRLEEKYVEFLAEVTDDIVKRGIYTNKGIKSIFQTHIIKHADLNMDKMLSLLERLRMDMGVPKDDSLNQMDFGYGSVDYSSGPYFYKGPVVVPAPSKEDMTRYPLSPPESDPGGGGGTYVKNSRNPSVELTDDEDHEVEAELQQFVDNSIGSPGMLTGGVSMEEIQEDHNHNLIESMR